jgi:Polyketide cyclase / dehydrase and lipid transport
MPYLTDVHATSSAAPEVVFEHLAVAEAWGAWGRFPTKPTRERQGTEAPNGIGAIRRIWPAREKIVEYEPPTRYSYTALSGIPVKHYRADVTLTPLDGQAGTTIRWQGRYEPMIPGTGPILRAVFDRMLAHFARALAAHAENCEPGCPGHPR